MGESSHCVYVCFFFFRYFKKDKAVWYFSRQLCKAFVSIRRLKTTEVIFIGGWSIIHELVSLFKRWVGRKTNAVDKVRSKRKGQRRVSVMFKTGAYLSLLCIRQAWTMCWAERNEANLYLLSCFWEPLQPSPPLPILGNLTCSTAQEKLGQKCLPRLLPRLAPAQWGLCISPEAALSVSGRSPAIPRRLHTDS